MTFVFYFLCQSDTETSLQVSILGVVHSTQGYRERKEHLRNHNRWFLLKADDLMTSFIAYGKSTFCGFSEKLTWLLIYFSELLHLSRLTFLCLDHNHSNLLKYVPKCLIVYSCVALSSHFVLDKIICCPFSRFPQRTSCANQFPCDGNTCPFADGTNICSIPVMYVYCWSIYITCFKWIICLSIFTLSSLWIHRDELLSIVHKYF